MYASIDGPQQIQLNLKRGTIIAYIYIGVKNKQKTTIECATILFIFCLFVSQHQQQTKNHQSQQIVFPQ